jgi:chemotaxis response regulator CheB
LGCHYCIRGRCSPTTMMSCVGLLPVLLSICVASPAPCGRNRAVGAPCPRSCGTILVDTAPTRSTIRRGRNRMAEQPRISQLVVVGASAGGVEALFTLVATLPGAFPAPLVLAQHLDPRRPSHLAEILARRSTLPVRTVSDHAPLENGVVFVVPANRHDRSAWRSAPPPLGLGSPCTSVRSPPPISWRR